MKSSSGSPVQMMVWVHEVDVVGPYRLAITFSDGRSGVHDFSDIQGRSGAKIALLAEPDYFARVFLDDGVLTWPNGYDWDPISLYDSMSVNGELRHPQAAE